MIKDALSTYEPGKRHWLKVKKDNLAEGLMDDSAEVTGAEFSKAKMHIAGGISIRLPRVSRMREDKTVDTTTNLTELRHLCSESKKHIDINVGGGSDEESEEANSNQKKAKSGDLTQSKRKGGVLMEEPSTKRSKIEDEKNKEIRKSQLVEERTGDLFSAPSYMSLAHCISQDCAMRKGIAKQFVERFGRVDEIRDQGVKVGGVAVLRHKERYIYNLVTKEKYHEKPTMTALRNSLSAMQKHMQEKGVEDVAMPRIGCGLDLLQWRRVKLLLEEVFNNSESNIVIYTHGEDQMREHDRFRDCEL